MHNLLVNTAMMLWSDPINFGRTIGALITFALNGFSIERMSERL